MQTTELKPLMQTLAPHKVFSARLQEPACEVAVQDIHWAEPGAVHLLSGRYCLIELAEPPAPGRARYEVETADGQARTAGRLNLMPPCSSRTVRWNAGDRHAVVCLMEPERLGLLGGIAWRWDDIDPVRTVDMCNQRLSTGMQWLAEETACPSFGSALQASCILTMLALELHRHFSEDRTAPKAATGRLDAQQLARLKSLVEGNDAPEALSLAALAAACCLPAAGARAVDDVQGQHRPDLAQLCGGHPHRARQAAAGRRGVAGQAGGLPQRFSQNCSVW